jgi:hypothetical protein
MIERGFQHIRRNIVAYVALFFALSGASYATWMAPANSVNSRAIIDGQVTTPDLAHNAIRADEHCYTALRSCFGSKEIANGAVNTSELAPGAVGSSELAPNAITGDKVKDKSLTGADIANGSLTGWEIAAKSLGSAQIDEPSLAQGQAYTAYHDSGINVDSGSSGRILDLSLPAGTYFVIGKVIANGLTGNSTYIRCTTYTSSTSDSADSYEGNPDGYSLVDTLTMTTVASESSPFTLHMDCASSGSPAQFSFAKLTAVSVATNHVTHG